MKPKAHRSLLSSGLQIQALADHRHEDWWETTQRGLGQVGRPGMELLLSVSVSPECLSPGPSLLPKRLFLAHHPLPQELAASAHKETCLSKVLSSSRSH